MAKNYKVRIWCTHQFPLWVINGRSPPESKESAFGGRADSFCRWLQCLLLAKSRHDDTARNLFSTAYGLPGQPATPRAAEKSGPILLRR
jgi:hypothetical protein